MKKDFLHIVRFVKHYLGACLLVLWADFAFAQDIHFSQFMSSPMNLNPAHTGNFDGAIRAVGNVRQQWSSVTIPYQTFGLSVDSKKLFNFKNTAAGIGIYNDRTGDSRLNTFVANISMAFTFPFDKKNMQGITLGITTGITQRSINYSNLRFDNQYNGTLYDPNLGNNEGFSTNNHINPNIHAGLTWFKHKNARNKINTGIALYHITTPNQSFFTNQISLLDRRLNLHASFQNKISKRMDFIPSLLVNFQGAYQALTFGSAVKYIINPNAVYYRAVYLGLWTRAGDAAWFSAGMDYGNVYACISYDINYSTLMPASNLRGGVELSVIYIIKHLIPKRKRYLSCPDFL